MKEKLKQAFAWFNKNDDFVFSAVWGGIAVTFAMNGLWVAILFPAVVILMHLRLIQQKKFQEYFDKESTRVMTILSETVDEFATELAEVAGPKVSNDILRKCVERLQENRDKKDPPAPTMLDKMKEKLSELGLRSSET